MKDAEIDDPPVIDLCLFGCGFRPSHLISFLLLRNQSYQQQDGPWPMFQVPKVKSLSK
jgi:hypothetical protein